MVTIFKDFGDYKKAHYISVEDALKRIKTGAKDTKIRVEEIREIFKSGGDYEDKKKSLPCVVFAGKADKFVKNKWGEDSLRLDASVTEHSGLIVLDFDEGDTELIKQRLVKDTYIYAVWQGVTKGCKALVKVPPVIEKHNLYYNAFLSRYPELDTTSKNISRLCFESYDPNLWVNEKSMVWDKTMTDEEWKESKAKLKDKQKKKLKDITSSMIANAKLGEKHIVLLRAARLLGGYVKTKLFTFKEAKEHLLTQITKKDIKDVQQAEKTIEDGLTYGMSAPLHELKEIEKETDFTRREDGTYDFLADEEEMDEYEEAVINGTLQMGLPTGMPKLNEHWLFKENHVVWMAARDNVGKSFMAWYLAVLASMLHGWKFLVYSKENRDGAVRKKIKEFYIGKPIKTFSLDERERASLFVNSHFKFFTAKKMHTVKEFLIKCEVIFDEGWEYNCVIGDPFNAFDIPETENQYILNIKSLNLIQTFKENYASIWVTDHVNSSAARSKASNGDMTVPTKHDVEFGQMKPNKADDFLIYHRNFKDNYERFNTEFHVEKVKDVETGGLPTPKDEPVILAANRDLCGFSCDGVDPVKEHWERFNLYNKPKESTAIKQNTDFNTENTKDLLPLEKSDGLF